MTRGKPRLFWDRQQNCWICTDEYFEGPSFAYYERGRGKTAKEAWENAFPTPFKEKLRTISLAQVERLKSALKVKTTEELVAKARGLFIVNKSVNTNIDKK